MDKRQFPGGPSQAVVVPSVGLRELGTFAQTALQQGMSDLAVESGALRAYSTTSTVQAQGSPNMTVHVTPFAAYGGSPVLHGLGFSPLASGQTNAVITGDGLTAVCDVTIAAANGSNPRRDLICFQIQEFSANYSTNTLTTVSLAAVNPSTGAAQVPAEFYPNTMQRVAIKYVQGTAGASPALPSVPAGWYPLAEIYVPTSATTITNGNIFYAVPEVNRGHSLTQVSEWYRAGFSYITSSGLNVAVKGGNFNIDNAVYSLSDTVLTLTDATTNYIFVNSAGVLTSNTSGFADPCIPLATAITSGGNITSLTDKRSWLTPLSTTSGSSGGGSLPVGITVGAPPLYLGVATVRLPVGFTARSSDNTLTMTIASNQTVDLAAAGANGLTAGYSEAVSTFYDLLIIGDSSGTNAPKGMFVPRAGVITMPVGYDKWADTRTRWRNDSSGNLIPCFVRAEEQVYEVQFLQNSSGGGPTQALGGGTSATFADVSLGAFVPSDVTDCVVFVINVVEGNIPFIRRKGETHGGMQTVRSDQEGDDFRIQTDASQTIQYKKGGSGSVDILVRSFSRPTARTS